jgi:hypothetical protein
MVKFYQWDKFVASIPSFDVKVHRHAPATQKRQFVNYDAAFSPKASSRANLLQRK